ncbi:MAG: HAD family hydrolase [Nitrospiria bacterium]
MSKRYKGLLFDLCGTLMQYRIDRMPLIEFEGKQVHTTTPLLYACFLEFDRGKVSYERFHTEFVNTTEAIARKRDASGKEILSATRFESFLNRLNADLGKRRNEIQRLLKDIHLARVAKCLEFLPRHRDLLLAWGKTHRIGLVTNFDDTQTVRNVLSRERITDLFDVIIISAEFGLRKPRREIFLRACDDIGASVSETLFVGDSWESDVVGAKSIGLDTAWINPHQIPQPDKGRKADYHFSDLAELDHVLNQRHS